LHSTCVCPPKACDTRAVGYPLLPTCLVGVRLDAGNHHSAALDWLAVLYIALKRAGASAELHIFAHTRHGFGVRPDNRPPVSGWIQLFIEWLDVQGMLKQK